MWCEGTVTIKGTEYTYQVKVYDMCSDSGINRGRVSKLTVKIGKLTIAHYDRDWDIMPKKYDFKLAVRTIIDMYK